MSAIGPSKSQYAQVADLLRERIESGVYAPGSALPSEPVLADELGVSRPTVNLALRNLRTAGLVKVKRGSGTFVRKIPRIYRDASKRYNNAYRDKGIGPADVEVKDLGHKPHTDIEISKVQAAERVAKHLDIAEGSDVLRRRRKLHADDEPTQIADSYYPWALAKDTRLAEPDTGQGGSYARLHEINRGPVRFSEDIVVRLATDDESSELQLDGPLPVIDLAHTAYDESGVPIAVTFHTMPSHLWKLHYEWDDTSTEKGKK